MTRTAETSPVTQGYLEALAVTGRPIGDAKKPAGQENLYPYGVLYTSLSRSGGDLVEPHEDGLHRLQVTVVGLTRASVDGLCDLVLPVLVDKSTSIDDHLVVWTEVIPTPPTQRDEDVKPAAFSRAVVVNAYITPASSGS